MSATNLQLHNVVIDPEVAALIPPPRAEERELLAQSLRSEGCREPLVVWQETGVLLDGYNRFDICTTAGIEFAVGPMSFASRDQAIQWVIRNQLGRRNLADIDRIALTVKLEPLIAADVRKRQGVRTDLPQKSAEGAEGRETREVAAAAADVSHDTFSKGKKILERGVPELTQAVRQGKVSINAASAIADLPADEQAKVLTNGTVAETAKKLQANRRTQSTGNPEWGTPRHILDAVRQVLGTIDIDPATHESAQRRVQAKSYYTKDNDGLTKTWAGTVFLNPPYAAKAITKFIDKLLAEVVAGNTTAAIVLTNNETDAKWFQVAGPRASAICFGTPRLKFLRPEGQPSRSGALQGQAYLYFGKDVARFIEVFGKFGFIVAPIGPALEM